MIFVVTSTQNEYALHRFASEFYLQHPNIMILTLSPQRSYGKVIHVLHSITSVELMRGELTDSGSIRTVEEMICKRLFAEAKKDNKRELYVIGNNCKLEKICSILFTTCHFNTRIPKKFVVAEPEIIQFKVSKAPSVKIVLNYCYIYGGNPWEFLNMSKNELICYMRHISAEKHLGFRYNKWLDVFEPITVSDDIKSPNHSTKSS